MCMEQVNVMCVEGWAMEEDGTCGCGDVYGGMSNGRRWDMWVW